MLKALEGLRILDLTEREGQLCGRLLADLGAEVIKIEPLQGDPARRTGPFAGNKPDSESSLAFINLNTNKKSVTLDLGSEEGRLAYKRLAKSADAIVETSDSGLMRDWGLDYEALKKDEGFLHGLLSRSRTGLPGR